VSVQLIRGADETIDVRFRGAGNLEDHTLSLFDVSPSLAGRLSIVFVSFDAEEQESLLRVSVEGTDPIRVGAGRFRIQATLGGSSVASRSIEVRVV